MGLCAANSAKRPRLAADGRGEVGEKMPQGSPGPVSPRPRCDGVCGRFLQVAPEPLAGDAAVCDSPDFPRVREQLETPKLEEVISIC